MYGSRAASRYAKALLEFARSNGKVDEVYEDMRLLKKTIASNKDLQRLLSSPVIKSKIKLNIINKVFTNTGEETQGILKLLIENRRLSLLELVAEKYLLQYHAYKGKKEAVVTTAQPLTEELEKEVLAKVKELTNNTNVTLKNIVNPAIIGGFVLRVEDLQYNASVAYKLSQYKQNFQKNLFV